MTIEVKSTQGIYLSQFFLHLSWLCNLKGEEKAKIENYISTFLLRVQT